MLHCYEKIYITKRTSKFMPKKFTNLTPGACIIKFIKAVIVAVMAGAYRSPEWSPLPYGLHSNDRLLAFPANIRLE